MNHRNAVKTFHIKMLNSSFHINHGQNFSQKPLFLKNRDFVNQRKVFYYTVFVVTFFGNSITVKVSTQVKFAKLIQNKPLNKKPFFQEDTSQYNMIGNLNH